MHEDIFIVVIEKYLNAKMRSYKFLNQIKSVELHTLTYVNIFLRFLSYTFVACQHHLRSVALSKQFFE